MVLFSLAMDATIKTDVFTVPSALPKNNWAPPLLQETPETDVIVCNRLSMMTTEVPQQINHFNITGRNHFRFFSLQNH